MSDLLSIVTKLLAYDATTGIFTWKVNRSGFALAGTIAGTYDKDGYRIIKVLGKKYRAHRLAWLICKGKLPEKELDHINGVRDDNRILNLREADRHLQTSNTHNNHEVVGVRYDEPNRRYCVSLTVKGKVYRANYPVKKFGEEAKRLAIKHRKDLEDKYLCQK